MKRISVLGTAALLVLGLYATVSAVASASPVVTAVADVCPEDGKIEPNGNEVSIPVAAPEGQVIIGYCVKAGSGNQEEGTHYEEFDPPETMVTISHPSGKEISHYTVFYAPAPTPTEPTPTPTPMEPTPTPTEPTQTPVPATPPTQSTPPSELASTGPAETIGYSMLALALIGGGAAFIVLARRRLA